ncbi:MAG: hypothetical protein FJ000_05975 [Actinobacteria bacterium]|nr:hypothetical protein [Actinomycetota bacterium]
MTEEVTTARRLGGGGWLAVAAVVPGTLGIVLAFYSLVARFDEGTVALSVSGWHFSWAVLSWSAVVVAAAIPMVCLVGRLPGTAVGLCAWVAVLLGVVAAAGAAASFVDKPGVMDMAASVVEHVDRDVLLEVAAPASGWTRAGGGVEYGIGLYLLSLAAVCSLVGGLLQARGAGRRRGRPGTRREVE